MSVAGNIIDTDHGIIDADPRLDACGRSAAPGTKTWTASYLRKAAAVDGGCALAAGLLAAQLRFGSHGGVPATYLTITGALPALWCAAVLLAGGYDSRFIGQRWRRVPGRFP